MNTPLIQVKVIMIETTGTQPPAKSEIEGQCYILAQSRREREVDPDGHVTDGFGPLKSHKARLVLLIHSTRILIPKYSNFVCMLL